MGSLTHSVKAADISSLEIMKLSVSTRDIGQHFEFHSTIDSTNRRCKELAECAPHGLCGRQRSISRSRAKRPTVGVTRKLRLVRLLSIRSKLPLRLTPLITLTTAVSLVDTLRTTLNYQPGIKWPNDLLDPDSRRKLAGILVEASSNAQTLNYAVIGIGLNLKTSALPSELRSYAIGLDEVTSQAPDPSSLLSGLCGRLEGDLDTLLSGDSTSILPAGMPPPSTWAKPWAFTTAPPPSTAASTASTPTAAFNRQKPYYSGNFCSRRTPSAFLSRRLMVDRSPAREYTEAPFSGP